MSLKGVKHLDYAIYGNLIVPLLMFDTDTWFQIDDDSENGKCQVISRKRKNRSVTR